MLGLKAANNASRRISELYRFLLFQKWKSMYPNVVFMEGPLLCVVHDVTSIFVFNLFMKNSITVLITIHNLENSTVL